MTVATLVGAALAEIAGCFAFWAWLRLDKSPWWLAPGMAALALFAYPLTIVEVEHAGRGYAAYGGVYIAASLAWLWVIEGTRPDRWDLIRRRHLPWRCSPHPLRAAPPPKSGCQS